MIQHLQDREKALELFDWKDREAEWVALVCLHSGVFTRAQFCYFLDAVNDRKRAGRFVHDLVERGLGIEYALPNKRGGAKAIRISNKPIYRALGIENVRHRRESDDSLMLRRLLSLDYVLEHPELPWLPTEREKVAFFDSLSIDRNRIPHRIYQGAVKKQTRYFALKLPIAADANSATFAYVDPGNDTDSELRSWGGAHEWLWRSMRLQGIEVRAVVVGADYKATIRAEAALKTWSSRAAVQSSHQTNGTSRNDLDVKAEIRSIENAVLSGDTDIIAQYGGLQGVSERLGYLKNLPKANSTVGPTIDDYETWVSDRLRLQDSDL